MVRQWLRASSSALVALAAFAVTLLASDVALACPSCKQALAQNGRGDVVAGYFWSILFMLSMPFTLLAGFSGYFYWLVRRARTQGGVDPTPSGASASSSVTEPAPNDSELLEV